MTLQLDAGLKMASKNLGFQKSKIWFYLFLCQILYRSH